MDGPKKPRFSAPYIHAPYIQLSDLGSPRDHRDDAAIERDGTPTAESSARVEAPPRDTSVISRKELARELRREAYQRAKKARAVDPKHLALKEAAKQRRREVYQAVKKRRKEQDAEIEAKHKMAQAQARDEAKRQLAERVKKVIAKAAEPGESLARDIEHALQSARVRELMERLAHESPALAAQHRDDEAGR